MRKRKRAALGFLLGSAALLALIAALVPWTLRAAGLRTVLPLATACAALVCVLSIPGAVWLVLTRTVIGRRLYAVGDNAASARLCGLPVRTCRGAAYVACGAFAAN